MSLTTTAGSVSADAYCTVDYADAYAAEVGGADQTAWDALEAAAQEANIKQATRFIDRFSWYSRKYDASTVTAGQPNGQAREFPRLGDVDGNGDLFILPEVQECCALLAIKMAGGMDIYASDASTRRMKAGVVEIEFDEGGSTAGTANEIVHDLLGHLMARTARMC